MTLIGGVAVGVLLTPTAAFAGPPPLPTIYPTTTTVTATQAPGGFFGATLNVAVSVSAGAGNPSPTGTVTVLGAGGGCTATLAAGPGGTSTGNCPIDHVPFGTYTLKAYYPTTTVGLTVFNWSKGQYTITVGLAPVFDVASPPLTATPGQTYSYTFHARGFPAPTYALAGAPSWLNINSNSGTVWGTVPYWVTSFSYSVTASNGVGSPATAGPYTVYVRHFGANINTSLSCTPKVFTGQKGSCTLWVSNRGFSPASNVTAQIALPPQLRADFCGYFFYFGCRIFNNTAYENLGTLNPGGARALTVVFTARSGFSLWGRHPGHPFTVTVVGSATSFGNFGFFGQRTSFSTAYVTIIPRGFWW